MEIPIQIAYLILIISTLITITLITLSIIYINCGGRNNTAYFCESSGGGGVPSGGIPPSGGGGGGVPSGTPPSGDDSDVGPAATIPDSAPIPTNNDFSEPMIGWWWYPYPSTRDDSKTISPNEIAAKMGYSPSSINTVFNLASGAVPAVDGTLNCSPMQGDAAILQPLPTTGNEFNVLNFGGWGNQGNIAVKWSVDSFNAITDNITAIARYCKEQNYNLISFDVEGVGSNVGTAANNACAAVKQAGLGIILTLPGFGVSEDQGGNTWFESIDQSNVDKLCLMYYNLNIDSCLYNADDIKNNTDPLILAYPPEKLILGVSCDQVSCGCSETCTAGEGCGVSTETSGFVTDTWVQSKFKGGVSVWAKIPTVTTDWNDTDCPL